MNPPSATRACPARPLCRGAAGRTFAAALILCGLGLLPVSAQDQPSSARKPAAAQSVSEKGGSAAPGTVKGGAKSSAAVPKPAETPAPSAAKAPATPAVPEAGTTPAPAGASDNGLVGFLVSLGVLALLFFGLYVAFRSGALSTEKLFSRLGLNPPAPEECLSDGSSELRREPPPVQVPPGACPYCGQPKDPVTGACACAVSPSAAAPTSTPGGPRLLGLSGPAAGQVYLLEDGAFLGRDAGNQVALASDSAASRRHARFEMAGGVYRLRDLGSANGTFVNGARTTEAELKPGDEIGIGQSRFRFDA